MTNVEGSYLTPNPSANYHGLKASTKMALDSDLEHDFSSLNNMNWAGYDTLPNRLLSKNKSNAKSPMKLPPIKNVEGGTFEFKDYLAQKSKKRARKQIARLDQSQEQLNQLRNQNQFERIKPLLNGRRSDGDDSGSPSKSTENAPPAYTKARHSESSINPPKGEFSKNPKHSLPSESYILFSWSKMNESADNSVKFNPDNLDLLKRTHANIHFWLYKDDILTENNVATKSDGAEKSKDGSKVKLPPIGTPNKQAGASKTPLNAHPEFVREDSIFRGKTNSVTSSSDKSIKSLMGSKRNDSVSSVNSVNTSKKNPSRHLPSLNVPGSSTSKHPKSSLRAPPTAHSKLNALSPIDMNELSESRLGMHPRASSKLSISNQFPKDTDHPFQVNPDLMGDLAASPSRLAHSRSDAASTPSKSTTSNGSKKKEKQRLLLSSAELRRMCITEKFIKEAKNMYFIPQTNAFYPKSVAHLALLSPKPNK